MHYRGAGAFCVLLLVEVLTPLRVLSSVQKALVLRGLLNSEVLTLLLVFFLFHMLV